MICNWRYPSLPLLARSFVYSFSFQSRFIHRNNVELKLNKLGLTRDKHLDEYPIAPTGSSLKFQKEKFVKELLEVEKDFFNEFDTTIDHSMKKTQKRNVNQNSAKSGVAQYNDKKTLKMYKLLRPDALPFYKEDSLLKMEKRMNEVSAEGFDSEAYLKVIQNEDNEALKEELIRRQNSLLENHLPSLNEKAFILAVEAVCSSLADDLETICRFLDVENIPARTEPERFNKLIECLFNSFALYGDPSAVDKWMSDCWPRLKRLMPSNIKNLSDEAVSQWLKGHLSRVKVNKAEALKKKSRRKRSSSGEWYNIAEDLVYDDYPLPPELINEWKRGFPLEKAAQYLKHFASFFEFSTRSGRNRNSCVSEQFQELIYDLKKIGLENWLSMDLNDFDKHLPRGYYPNFNANEVDMKHAKQLIRAAAKGKANLLQFEAFDPYKFFNNFEQKSVEEELRETRDSIYVSDKEIEEMFDIQHVASVIKKDAQPSERVKRFVNEFGKTPIECLYEEENKFQNSLNPIQWQHQDEEYATWKWKPPENAVYDAQQGKYVRLIEGLDPQLDLQKMRYVTMEVTKMMSMSADGRVFYYRAIVAVGNGRGMFGIGVGYGNTAHASRSQASLDAVKKMEFIDFDDSSILTTPVHGSEYSAHVKITPRPMGRGVQCNRRFLPLAYIIGLDNCKLSFHGSSTRWLTRTRALRRALDGIQSRRTIANATGKKYSLLVAPGDHWVHWPDRWFIPIHKQYENAISTVRAMRRATCRGSIRSNVGEIIPQEITNNPNKLQMKFPHLQSMLLEQHATALKLKRPRKTSRSS